jgi:glycosyltransferase involved in cell wall biosynthesis
MVTALCGNAMKILFCIHDFHPGNLALQPWLTVHRVATGLVEFGCDCHVLTDCGLVETIDGVHIHSADSLRGTNSRQVNAYLNKIQPHAVIVSVTPMSLVTTGWYRELAHYQAFAFLSYPFYNLCETIRAMPHLDNGDRWAYGRHQLIPRPIWRQALKRYFRGAFCQSERSGNRIASPGKSSFGVYPVQPGIDRQRWLPPTRDNREVDLCSFLFTGSPSSIRGFNLVLDAFKKLGRGDARLKIMARGGDGSTHRSIQRQADRLHIINRVAISTGWASADDLRQAIWEADAVLLPFVLVPSELPVTVLEVIACGRPVIVSDIDGLPEAGEGCALVVEQGDVNSLSAAMQTFCENRTAMMKTFRFDERRDSMLTWDRVAQKWLNVLRGEVHAA